MHPDLAALVRKHGLDDDDLAALRAALGRGSASAASTLDAYDSVSLEDGPPADAEAPRVADRYVDLDAIGSGAMGEVRRVRDLVLNRTLAMKIAHAPLLRRPAAMARFLEEAQATAQLQHPSIVPVHDLGRLPDGRVWFTMKEIRGQTLSEAIAEAHAGSPERLQAAPRWTLRGLVAVFHVVCQAVAYAHERGVVHRDLKPANAMVGDHGEVYVLDWGLAKIVGRPDRADEAGERDVVRTSRAAGDATRLGQVAGTPAYMPPEQARGDVHHIDARSDVYALGAMLYEILSGAPPYRGGTHQVLEQVLLGPPPPIAGSPVGPQPPPELVAVCARAMDRDPARRFPTASALAEAVRAWLDGSQRREQALAVVDRALAAAVEAQRLAEQAQTVRAQAIAQLEGIAPWEPEERKAAGWALHAQAEDAERSAKLKQVELDQGLQAALRIVPDLRQAHALLAERAQSKHAAAEAARDPSAAAEAQTLLEAHAGALPEGDAYRAELGRYLRGDGALTLVTDPPGAEVLLYRYVERNRRLVEVFERSLGTTPLDALPLPMGSWLAVLRHPGRAEVRYPFEVTRLGHWDGVRPGSDAPAPVWLPPTGHLGPDEIYVPTGWTRVGGETDANAYPPMRVWCDAVVFQRFPVTNRAYLAFLDDLVRRDRVDEALHHAPWERGGLEAERGRLVYGFDGQRFSLRPDTDGDMWELDWPVFQVDWFGARAYLAWLADRTGRPWRLPAEIEWEKAARGADGRRYPWGDHHDPSWCHMSDSMRGTRRPAVVDSYPIDAGPTGVRGLGGNVEQWCLDTYEAPPPVVGGVLRVPVDPEAASPEVFRSVRGGCWTTGARAGRSAMRHRLKPTYRYAFVGFRGAWSV